MTEDEQLEEINRLMTAPEELCLPYRSDDKDTSYDELVKEMPETEQAMAVHFIAELEHLTAQGPNSSRGLRPVSSALRADNERDEEASNPLATAEGAVSSDVLLAGVSDQA